MSDCDETRLWVTFRLDTQTYCVSSSFVDAIVVPSSVTPIPDAPDSLLGIMQYHGALIPLVELRTLFGMLNLAQYVEQFAQMKEMHIAWVRELEVSVRDCEPFLKPVDPHKCKFGQWYDHFHTDNFSLNYILKKLEAPHAHIHRCGAEINRLLGEDKQEERLSLLETARHICHAEIAPLLDQLIQIYQEVNRGIVLVLSQEGRRVGVLADEVTNLIPCADTPQQPFPPGVIQSPYLCGLASYGPDTMMILNANALLSPAFSSAADSSHPTFPQL